MSARKKLDHELKLVFENKAGRAKDALVMMFDLAGFASFYAQPDIDDYIAKYINQVFGAVSTTIDGGEAYWSPKKEMLEPFLTPVYTKFLGDGALYLWTFNKGERDKAQGAILHLINRLWNLKLCFGNILAKCSEDTPLGELPANIRFGLAAGSVHQVNYKYTQDVEYVGYCINLASRLQSYCRELGFIASARLGFKDEVIEKHGYLRVVATKIKGFPREIVFVDRDEFADLDSEIRDELFEPAR